MGSILALDIAGRTGVAEGEPGEVPRLYSELFWRQDDEHADTFGRAIHWITKRTIDYRPRFAIVEAPLPSHLGRNNDSNAVVLGLQGAVTGLLRCRGIPVHFVGTGKVRKHFIGKGNLPGKVAKPLCMARCKQLGWDCPDLDAADAGATWDWACQTLGKAYQ